MEVGPFRTVPASQTASGQVELRLVEGGWEEFATIVFGEFALRPFLTSQSISRQELVSRLSRPMGISTSLTR
jgi:hypothetical protein